MLEKRDRGRGADADLAVRSYGAARVHSRVEGAELLQVPHAHASPATYPEVCVHRAGRSGAVLVFGRCCGSHSKGACARQCLPV